MRLASRNSLAISSSRSICPFAPDFHCRSLIASGWPVRAWIPDLTMPNAP